MGKVRENRRLYVAADVEFNNNPRDLCHHAANTVLTNTPQFLDYRVFCGCWLPVSTLQFQGSGRWQIACWFAMLRIRSRTGVSLEMNFSHALSLQILGVEIGKNGVRP